MYLWGTFQFTIIKEITYELRKRGTYEQITN